VIVIDIGCARYGGDYSIERLIEEFNPAVLYGFDPNPAPFREVASLGEGLYGEYETEVDACRVVVQGRAAWTYDGQIGYRDEGLNSWLTDYPSAPKVPCFDLARFIAEISIDDGEIVLKCDAEGSEYELLEHLIATRTDALLKLAWIEWHPKLIENAVQRRAKIEAEIACELAEWNW